MFYMHTVFMPSKWKKTTRDQGIKESELHIVV